MTSGSRWLDAFPLPEADRAVRAIRSAWDVLSATHKPKFHHYIDEPKLTKVVKAHVQRVTGRALGLLGFWGAEDVEDEVDFGTGEILAEHRTDIIYAWNDDKRFMHLVFEFKKLDDKNVSHKKYLGDSGLLRFVTGPYSREQSVALMVGILVSPRASVVPPIETALQHPSTESAAQMCRRTDGALLHRPSALFSGNVEFDTEHRRPKAMAPPHGTIMVSHLFLEFGYPAPPRVAKPIRAGKKAVSRKP